MSSELSKASPRRYDNRLRTEQAAATRGRVLLAARDAFIDRGYAGASMTAIAQAAGVSRETLYKVFGTKARLLKAVYDVLVVGDDEPVPVLRRQAWLSMTEDPDPRSMLRTFGRLTSEVVARVAPIAPIIAEGAGDPELADLAETTRTERLLGCRSLVEVLDARHALRLELEVERATDVVWALCSPEMALLLTEARGWSLEEYAAWLAESLAVMVLADEDRLPRGDPRLSPPSS